MNTTVFDPAIKSLIAHTQFLSTDQIVSEIELVQERLRFVPELLKQKREHIADSLAEVLKGDISPEVLSAISEMASQDQFEAVRSNADLFLEACQAELAKYQEIVVAVAVVVDDAFKQKIAGKIHQRFTTPVRVVFQVNPSIIAGCIIHEPEVGVYDYSLRTVALPLVRQQLKHKLRVGASA